MRAKRNPAAVASGGANDKNAGKRLDACHGTRAQAPSGLSRLAGLLRWWAL